MTPGTLYTIGVGPGDPELMTLKAARLIAAAPVVAFFAKADRPGHARGIAAAHIHAGHTELRFDYPFTTEIAVDAPRYATEMAAFYDDCAARIGAQLDAGRDVALLCEGDPFFYGSSMYLFDRLGAFRTQVVPGVAGMSGCWAAAGLPMTHGDDCLAVLPGTLDAVELARRLAACDAAVIMKIGRHLGKIRIALAAAGRMERAVYVERGTMPGQRILPMHEVAETTAPYFALVLVPGRQRPR
jgi:precorrin-2/cobalt-factor-2 C20-methyltransferase